MTVPEQGDPEPELSWADVYRVQDCGQCRKPDCPQCVRSFLKLLHEHGTSRTGHADGVSN